MNRIPKSIVGLLLIVVLALAGCVTVEAPAADTGSSSDAATSDESAGESVFMIIPAEISGAGAVPGNNWADGAKLAIEHINASGGILGKMVEYEVLDTQTDPEISKSVIAKGLDQNPVAVIGTVYSSSTIVNMVEAERAGVPQFVGSEAASITQQGNQFVFRTSSGQSGSLPKLANYLVEEGVESVVIIYANTEFGQGGRDAAVKNFQERGIEIVAEISTEQQQADFAPEVLQSLDSGAQAIFSYLTEEESARLLIELEKQGSTLPIYGESVLLSQGVLDLAGSAANGARGHVNLSAQADVPSIQAFTAAFVDKYGYVPDHNGLKGYIGVYVYKAMAERIGDFDNAAIAEQLHCTLITAEEEPGVLMDVAYDEKGDIDRATFLVEVQDGEQVIIQSLPRLKNTCADQ